MDYKVMHKDKVIAFANENGIYELTDKKLCPACFVVGMPLEIWLDNRKIPEEIFLLIVFLQMRFVKMF